MSEQTANAQEQVEQTENQPAGGSFEAITTQEQFDNRIKNRIARAESSTRKAVEAEYAEALEKARQFDELQEANKSELQKEKERAEKAEQEVARLTHERQLAEWAKEAAEKHGGRISPMAQAFFWNGAQHSDTAKCDAPAFPSRRRPPRRPRSPL